MAFSTSQRSFSAQGEICWRSKWWRFRAFSADSHLLWLAGHIQAKGKYESLILHWRFSLHCFIPPAMCSKISLSALCLHTEPVSDLKLKLHAFSFTNVPSLVESHVQLWMNSHNILAAVYLGFCSLCWLASTERQTKHSGGCQLMFFSLQHRLLN